MKEAYDRGGYKRTLEVAIKTVLKGTQKRTFNLVSLQSFFILSHSILSSRLAQFTNMPLVTVEKQSVNYKLPFVFAVFV